MPAHRRALALLAAVAASAPAAALAHEVLYATEQGRAWAVKVYESDGEAVADAPFEVYSPADPKAPHSKGRTDRAGYLSFVPDQPGAWRVRVLPADGHGLDTTIQVGAAAPPAPPAPGAADFALRPLIGVAAVVGVFAVLVAAYRRRKAP